MDQKGLETSALPHGTWQVLHLLPQDSVCEENIRKKKNLLPAASPGEISYHGQLPTLRTSTEGGAGTADSSLSYFKRVQRWRSTLGWRMAFTSVPSLRDNLSWKMGPLLSLRTKVFFPSTEWWRLSLRNHHWSKEEGTMWHPC